jgi:hypothetical protein
LYLGKDSTIIEYRAKNKKPQEKPEKETLTSKSQTQKIQSWTFRRERDSSYYIKRSANAAPGSLTRNGGAHIDHSRRPPFRAALHFCVQSCGYSAKAGKRTAVLGVNDFRNEVGFVYLALNHGDGQGN